MGAVIKIFPDIPSLLEVPEDSRTLIAAPMARNYTQYHGNGACETEALFPPWYLDAFSVIRSQMVTQDSLPFSLGIIMHFKSIPSDHLLLD